MVKVKIERYNNQLEGIGYIGGKIIFIPKTKVGDIVDVNIIDEKSSYYRGEVSVINSKIDCPYFYECGGCSLRNFSYEDTLKLKQNSFESLLKGKNISVDNVNIHPNVNHYNYRNKISLKIVNGKVGYYKEKTNTIVEIDNCLIAKDAINEFLKEIPNFKIKNGDITIRCNYNDELLIIIKTDDDIKYDFKSLKEEHKIAGVIVNNKTVLNDNFFIDKINEKLFKISYDSFFQVNNYGAELIVNIIKSKLSSSDKVLDLYCGVGALGLSVSDNIDSLIGIEIVPNAIENALFNSRMNRVENANFILGDVSKSLDKIKSSFNTVIFDPPRAGLDSKTKDFVLESKPKKIIYVSCNPITLVRDLSDFINDYKICSVDLVDMFSYSYHVESVCVLERK